MSAYAISDVHTCIQAKRTADDVMDHRLGGGAVIAVTCLGIFNDQIDS
jgi:hypothetical protein